MYSTLGLLKRGAGGGGSSGGGTFPSIISLTLTQDNAAPYNITMPATVEANDLLIMILTQTTASTATVTTPPSGWSTLYTGSESNNAYYKWATGIEDGTTETISMSSASVRLLFSVIQIRGADTGQNPQGVRGSVATTSTPNPPAIDPSWATANNLFIAWVGSASVRTIVAYPAGYIFHQQTQSSADGTIFIAAKQLAGSALEDPGIFTISSSADCFNSTIAVKGA